MVKHEYCEESSSGNDRSLKKEVDKDHQKAVVGFVADGSGSISNDHSMQVFSVIRSAITILHGKNAKNQFFVIEFASTSKVHSRISDDLDEILSKIPKGKTLSGGTNLAGAMDECSVIYNTEMTDKRRKFLFILTDGMPDNRNEAVMRANDLKMRGVDICVIGIGSGIDMNFIKSISPHKGYLSKPSQRVFQDIPKKPRHPLLRFEVRNKTVTFEFEKIVNLHQIVEQQQKNGTIPHTLLIFAIIIINIQQPSSNTLPHPSVYQH